MNEFSGLGKVRTADQATYLWIAETVLRKHQRALKARTIVSFGLDDGLFGDLDISKTPQKSMQARLSVDIIRHGKKSRFMRVGRGDFFLRDLWSKQRGSSALRLVDQEEYVAERRSPPVAAENVLVIPKDACIPILSFQGVSTDHKFILSSLIATRQMGYMPRTVAETDSTHVITQGVQTCTGIGLGGLAADRH